MIKALISDADGTLVNTLYLIRHGQYEAVAQSLMTDYGVHRHDLPSYEQYEIFLNQSVGGPTRHTLEETYRKFSAQIKGLEISEIGFDKIDANLQAIQDRIAPLYVHPYPGLDDLLRLLSDIEVGLAIYSSGYSNMIVRNFGVSIPSLGQTELYKSAGTNDEKLQAFCTRLKAIYDLPQFITITAEDVTAYKPDPEGIFKAIDRLGVSRDEVVVLGDHEVDMAMAKRAGVSCIGITHGFSSEKELRSSGADIICNNLHEVIYHLRHTY